MTSTTTNPIPIPANIGTTAGPLLLGYVFNWGLFGALSVQVYLYYMSFPKDRLGIKSLVFGLYLLEILQTVIITHDMFLAYAAEFGNLSTLGSTHLEWLAVPILGGIVSGTVQMFFAFRIALLSNNKYIGIGIAALALTQAASAITGGVQAFVINDFAQLQSKAFVSSTIWLAGSAICDVIIAGCMSYFLSRKDTGFKATRILIKRLVRLTIETGSLTALIATIEIILFLAFRHNNYHTAPALTLGKLYTNTLLLIFNSRMRVIGGRDMTETAELLEMTTMMASTIPTPGRIQRFAARTPVTDITVRKDTWTDEINAEGVDGNKVSYLGHDLKGATLDLPCEGV